MRTILFVCTGNSCRSVMAAQMLKKLLGPGNKKIEVLSGGVSAISGMQPTEYTLKLLQKEGINGLAHRSSPISKAIIEKADLILVMEQFHKDRILEIIPEAKGKVHLLREFEKDPKEVVEAQIPDPIGKPLEVYERTFELIKEALQDLMKWMRESGWV